MARLVLGQQTSPGPCAPPPSSRRRWLRRRLDSRRAEGRGQRPGGGPLRQDPDVPAAAATARTAGTAAALRLDALRTLRAEGGTGPCTPGPDPDPPPRQPKPDLGTLARVEVGNSTGYTSVRACASWLSPLPVTASNPRDRSPTAFVACSVCLPRSSRPFHPHQHRTHFCFPNPTRKSTEN